MKPLAEMPIEARGRIRGVLTDLDGTLTTHGRLFAAAYTALERLRAAGLLVIPVTGRPAGWCDHIARMWPVDAVVGENGAFYFLFSHGRLQKHYRDPPECRPKQFANAVQPLIISTTSAFARGTVRCGNLIQPVP